MRENDNFNILPSELLEVMSNEKWEKTKATHDTFTVKYNGEAVKTHEMDVNDLVKSLTGLSSALERVTYIANGSKSEIFVKVKGSFKPGSFDVQLVTLLTCAGVQAAVNSVTLIGFIQNIGSLIWLFKRTKGETIKIIQQVDDNSTQIQLNNCQNITVNNFVLQAYNDSIVRKAMENFVYPLEEEDMSDITLLHNDIEQETITREERVYFHLDDDDIVINEGTDFFLITQSNFEGKKTGWKMALADSIDIRHGKMDFSVKIRDNKFLKSVKLQRIIISNEGTVIKAKYRKTITNGEDVKWEITEVENPNFIFKHSRPKHTTLTDF